MDSSEFKTGIFDRIVSGLKDKTIQYAESKLQNTIHEVPEEAVLGFVSFAVRSGAHRLEIRVESNDLILTHDGKKLSEADLARLPHPVESLPELSRALPLYLSHKDSQVEIHALTESASVGASYKGNSQPAINNKMDLNDLHFAKMTCRIVLKGSGNYRRVNQAAGNELPEIGLIRKRCMLAPIQITISGRQIDRYSNLPDSLATSSNFGPQHHPALATINSTSNRGQIIDLASMAPRLQTIQAGVCGLARSASDSSWYRLVYGVARPLKISWPPYSWGYLSVASGADPARIQQEIELIIAQLTNELYLSLEHQAGELAEETLNYLEQNRAILTTAGHSPVDQERLFLRIRERILPSSDARVLMSRLELAATLEADGKVEEAHKLYNDVIPVWESEALNHFDKYRWEEGASLWQRALTLREKLGHNPDELIDRYLRLAEIGQDNRLGFAEQAFRRAMQLLQKTQTKNLEREYNVLYGLAQVLKRNRVLTESLALAEKAHQIMLETNDGKETKALVPVLKLQAELYDLSNDYARSTELEQKALLLRFKR